MHKNPNWLKFEDCTLGKTTNQKQFGVEVITNNQEENY